MNNQKAEEIIRSSDTIQVHSIFDTIQGEGPFAGRPAIFIRLAGCNLQCPMCDTEYTNGRVIMTPETITAEVDFLVQKKKGIPIIVITGGEPMRQPIGTLVELLLRKYIVQIETNGTLQGFLTKDYGFAPNLHIVCSPKTHKINPVIERYVSAFKYVIKDGDVSIRDGLPNTALNHPCEGGVARPPAGFPRYMIYVQPLDEGSLAPYLNGQNVEATLASSRMFGYTFCLQVHKIIDLP